MDGTLATRMDGVNQATSYSNYKRGLPQNTGYANGTAESAVVSDIGVIESTTDQNGYTHTYGHDAMGRLSSIYYPAYDAVSWTPTTITLAQVAADEYGVASGHWRQTVETGNAQTISYLDALYRPVLTRTLDTAAPSSLKAVVQRYAFDGNVTFASYPQAWVGDVNAAVNGTTTTYNALKRRLTVVAASELGNLTTSYAYTTPFRTTVTNPRGKAITTSFSALDQPTDDAPSVMTLPYGIPVTIVRDIYGKPSSITRGSGGVSATRSYVYDGFQRLCKTVEPETGATIQSHDAAGNVQWRASGLNLPALNDCSSTSVPPASKVSFTYDTLNRLTGTTYSDGSPAITRTYTADGLPETVTSNGATWTTSYHRRRLPFQESLDYAGTTYRLTTGYNANGHADTLTYPDSTVVPYTLNALGEAATVGGYGQLITYHPTGALASFTYGNNITRSMTPNARGLPWQVSEPGILQDVYDYDANGNVARITDQVAGAVTTRTMTYDDLDRLSGVSAPALWGNAAYTYDNLDNIVASSVSAGATARSLSHAIDYATNRISSLSGTPSYSFGYAYDAQGNIVQRGAQAYVFDQGNRLASAPGKATYTYDGLGRRVRIVQADGTNRIQVYSGAGQLMYAVQTGGPLPPATTRYIYLHRHLLAEVTGAGVQYNHTDALGSPVASTSGAGGLLTRTRYEPYGMTAAGTTPTIGFTGHVNDADTGLINMQQRYYDPVAGRFLSIDPVTTDANSGGNFNRYAYANNSPYKYIDPDGRDPGEAYNPLLFRLTTFEGAKQGTTIGHAIANGAVARDAGAPLIAAADHLVANSGNIIAAVGQIKAGGRVAGPITNPTIGKVGRVIVDGKGNAMLEPAGGKTVPAGKGGVDTHTLYPNLSNAQRLNPQGHPNNPTPHGHQHQPGTGAGKSGQGPSTDPQGNVVKSNSSDAHWPIN